MYGQLRVRLIMSGNCRIQIYLFPEEPGASVLQFPLQAPSATLCMKSL